MIEVFETPTFKRVFKKLPEKEKCLVEDEIDKIIDDPFIGSQKKGDLSYLRIHKFKLSKQKVLLGYCYKEDKLHLYLMHLDSHENFYRDAKRRRSSDIDMIR